MIVLCYPITYNNRIDEIDCIVKKGRDKGVTKAAIPPGMCEERARGAGGVRCDGVNAGDIRRHIPLSRRSRISLAVLSVKIPSPASIFPPELRQAGKMK